MADKLTSIKIKQKNGSYTTQIPVSVSAQNVQWDGSHSLLDILGSVDINVGGKGNVQHQFDDLYQNIDAFTDDINSEMTDFTNSTNQNITNFTNSTNQSIADFTNTANQNFTDFTNATNQHLSDVLGNISTETKGTVQAQMDKLQNDMNTFHTQMAAEIGTDVSDWLQQNVTPAGSMTMVDNSLTISDAAADAKAVGDALTSLNGSLVDVEDKLEDNTTTTRNINPYPVGRYQINDSGEIKPGTPSMLGINGLIPVEAETAYTASFYDEGVALAVGIYCAYYDSEQTFISKELLPGSNTNTYRNLTTPASCAYICLYTYKSSELHLGENTYLQVEVGNVQTQYIRPASFLDAVSREFVDKIEPLFNVDLDIAEKSGYYNTSGGIVTQSYTEQEKYTQKISTDQYDDIVAVISYSEPRAAWCRYCTYDDNGDFITAYTKSQNNTAVFVIQFTPAANEKYVSFSYRTFGESDVMSISAVVNVGTTAKNTEKTENKLSDVALLNGDSFRFKPCYDHLFVNVTADYIVIPHESLYHVRISRLLGFNIIEANIGKTSDGVYIVNHLNNGKFGRYFQHVDGETDISNILVSSVTWDWIVENVRYTSRIAKYRTRPCRLEEFLSECRQQNIIPFIETGDADVIPIADSYMGKGNYIAYGATRATCPSGIIYHWVTRTSKAEILAYCERIGRPFIYGLANPTAFTDEQLKDIADTLHSHGYWIATSYNDDNWHKCSYYGFDLNGTQTLMNRLTSGSICNIWTMNGFGDFTYTNATEDDGVLTFTGDGTLTPNIDNATVEIGGLDVQIEFSGTITVPNVGEIPQVKTYISDGSIPVFFCTPLINKKPKIKINVASGTVIRDMKYIATSYV